MQVQLANDRLAKKFGFRRPLHPVFEVPYRNVMSLAGLRTHYEIPKSAMRKNYFAKAKISEIEEKNILPCIFKKNISIQFKNNYNIRTRV